MEWEYLNINDRHEKVPCASMQLNPNRPFERMCYSKFLSFLKDWKRLRGPYFLAYQSWPDGAFGSVRVLVVFRERVRAVVLPIEGWYKLQSKFRTTPLEYRPILWAIQPYRTPAEQRAHAIGQARRDMFSWRPTYPKHNWLEEGF